MPPPPQNHARIRALSRILSAGIKTLLKEIRFVTSIQTHSGVANAGCGDSAVATWLQWCTGRQ
jgi:hypothetical protein